MNDVAQATGGHAFYDDNAFKAITEHLLGSDGSFYTLTYSPRHLHFDNKWHKVHVEVDGAAYQLSYRSGYFADGSIRGRPNPPPEQECVSSKAERSSKRANSATALLSLGRPCFLHQIPQLPIWI